MGKKFLMTASLTAALMVVTERGMSICAPGWWQICSPCKGTADRGYKGQDWPRTYQYSYTCQAMTSCVPHSHDLNPFHLKSCVAPSFNKHGNLSHAWDDLDWPSGLTECQHDQKNFCANYLRD